VGGRQSAAARAATGSGAARAAAAPGDVLEHVAPVDLPGGLGPSDYGWGMTESSNPITVSHPPQVLLRVMNPMLKLILHTPFAGTARHQFMVLDFNGRKSGRHFSIPLTAHVIDGILYAMTGAVWKNNFRDGATASVLHDGKTTTMRGELITDRVHVADLYERVALAYGVKRAERVMGIGFRDHRMPTHDQFVEAIAELKLNAIRFMPA
jgi:hypothetical protein